MSLVPAFLRFCSASVRPSRPAFCGVLFVAAALSLAGLPPARVQAQSPGTVDISFNSPVTNVTVFNLGLRMNAANTTQELISGGDNRLLNAFNLADGTAATIPDPASVTMPPATLPALDVPFFFGGLNLTTYTLAFESTLPGTEVGTKDSRVFVAGLFGRYSNDSTPSQNITVINADGSLDLDFNPGGRGANAEVTALLPLQGDRGERALVAGGLFTEYNDQTHNHLVKLNSVGAVDTNYNPNLSADDIVFGLAEQIDPATGLPNGQVLVAGRFNLINNSEPAKLARLNADGSLDATFKPAFDTRAFTIVVQSDGKILVGGTFSVVNGRTANNIVRLNQDGTTDTSFVGSITGNVEPVNAPPTAVFIMKRNPDGRIYVGGNFTTADGVARQNLARLEADGTLDTSFDPGTASRNSVQTIAIQSGDHKVLVGETRVLKLNNNDLPPVDIIRLIGGPLLPSSVSVNATVRMAYRGSTLLQTSSLEGQYEIIRTASAANLAVGGAYTEPLTVSYTLSGAQLNVDYKLFYDANPSRSNTVKIKTGTITIPAGSYRVLIDLLPRKVVGENVSTTVKATLTLVTDADEAYSVGTMPSAKVKILPPLQPPG